MSKELEAFKRIWTMFDFKDMQYERSLIIKALTPPTADEVCMAIQNELPHGNVEYIEGNKEFMFVNRGEKSNVTSVYGDRYKITGFYKSSTITLIGRFYEGLEAEK